MEDTLSIEKACTAALSDIHYIGVPEAHAMGIVLRLRANYFAGAAAVCRFVLANAGNEAPMGAAFREKMEAWVMREWVERRAFELGDGDDSVVATFLRVFRLGWHGMTELLVAHAKSSTGEGYGYLGNLYREALTAQAKVEGVPFRAYLAKHYVSAVVVTSSVH